MVIERDAATAEVNKWLDFQGISEKQRTDAVATVNIVVNAVCAGHLIINEDNSLTQKLKHPFGDKVKISELKYKSTPITVREVDSFKAGVPEDTKLRSHVAHVCAATGELYSVLSGMSTKDYNTAISLIIFFMA